MLKSWLIVEDNVDVLDNCIIRKPVHIRVEMQKLHRECLNYHKPHLFFRFSCKTSFSINHNHSKVCQKLIKKKDFGNTYKGYAFPNKDGTNINRPRNKIKKNERKDVVKIQLEKQYKTKKTQKT